jgi:DNA repair exonuclease SbcCD ATPase subunit
MEIRAGDVSIHKTSLRNDIKTLIKLYREYVHTHKIKLSEEQLLEGEKLIVTYVKKLNDQETDATARDSFWCIKSVEFDNLFRYGKDNKVDFTKLTGLVGIFGNNFLGKSSLISVLCYGLFNKSDREGLKSGELINRSKKDANCKIVISVDGTDYVINRKLVLKEGKEDKAAVTSLSFCRIDKDNNLVEVLNEESRNDTDKVIRKLIGTREDFMVTSLASQYAPNNFISLGPTSRKAIINRFHDIDIFEKLFKYANDDNSILVAKTSNYQSITWDLNILKAEKELSEKQSRLDELNDSISNYRTKTEELRLWVRQHTEQIEVAKKLKKQEEELSKELLNSRSKFNSLKSSLERKITERENVIKNIEVLKRELLELDFNDL